MDKKTLNDMLDAIPTMDRPTLLHKFKKLYGRAAPPKLSGRLIQLAIAYRLQEQVYGKLDPAVKRRLINPESVIIPKVKAGTVLIREWHGQHHAVMVTDRGFEYRGEIFTSLTVIATRITGTKRSGPAFFQEKETDRGQ